MQANTETNAGLLATLGSCVLMLLKFAEPLAAACAHRSESHSSQSSILGFAAQALWH